LRCGHLVLSSLFDAGIGVLRALRQQSESLKSAQRRALDVLNFLGLSSALMRSAERRQRGDRLVVGCCMLITLCVFAGLVYWKARR
jgi:Golgi SNAP receptor complex protein 2